MKVIFNYATRQFEPMEPSMRERFALGGGVIQKLFLKLNLILVKEDMVFQKVPEERRMLYIPKCKKRQWKK